MANHAAMKLGRVRPTSKQRAKAPRLREFLKAPLPVAPEEFHGATGAAIGMFGNDTYGDCTIAGLANYRAIRAKLTGQPTPETTTDAVVAQYFKLTGGPDSGLNEGDVLTAAKNGLDLGGSPWADAVWATMDYDRASCKSLISVFGALYLGVELPTDAQNQDIWTPTTGQGGAPGGWGGHCILWSGWSKDDNDDDLVTWGEIKIATSNWVPEYADEVHVIVDADSAAIVGIDFERLVAYSNEVNNN
jgi:hypothetical protein